jgi:RNA polymerase-binding protein DksA
MAAGLNETETAELKKLLMEGFAQLREEVRQELVRSDTESFTELAGKVHDTGDASLADLLADLNLAIIDHHIRAIRETEAALLRIARGGYGYCADCDGEIGYERLHIHPTAERCLACQERYEWSYAQPAQGKL